MPRQTSSLVNDRLLSLVGSGAGWGADDDPVERLERGWVPVDPGSIEIPPGEGDDEEDDPARSARSARSNRSSGERGRRVPGRHRDPHNRRGPAVVTLPVSLRGARLEVSWWGIAALVIVLAVAASVFAVRVARAEGGVSSTPAAGATPLGVARSTTPSAFLTAGTSGVASGSAPGPAPGRSSGAAPGSESGSAAITVHVVGQVARPGVVTLPAESRVVDALTRAGGALAGADVARLNLAQFLTDGEQVYVPRPGEDPPVPIGGSIGSVATPRPGGRGLGGTVSPQAVIDLNTTDVAGLDSLPGVGPVLAQRILDWRAQHGRFSSVDELGEVSGIGNKLLEQLRPLVRV